MRIFPNQRRKAASLGRFIEAGDTSADAKQAAAGRLMRRLENLTFIDISRESKRCGGGGGGVPLTPQLSALVPGAEVDTQRARLSDDSSSLICLLPESDGSRRKIPGVERRHPCDRHGQPPRRAWDGITGRSGQIYRPQMLTGHRCSVPACRNRCRFSKLMSVLEPPQFQTCKNIMAIHIKKKKEG